MSSEITPARLRELLDAATPGPWKAEAAERLGRYRIMAQYAGPTGYWHEIAFVYDDASVNPPLPLGEINEWRANAALIALSPALAARVIELEGDNARLREALERVVEITEDNKLDQTAALVAALNVAQDGLSGRDAYAEYVAALETRHD